MRTVWKYDIPITDEVITHAMPTGAAILHVAPQRVNELQMWALVDTEQPPAERHFRVYGTGHPIDDFTAWPLGSALIMDGRLVFHVFEIVAFEGDF